MDKKSHKILTQLGNRPTFSEIAADIKVPVLDSRDFAFDNVLPSELTEPKCFRQRCAKDTATVCNTDTCKSAKPM